VALLASSKIIDCIEISYYRFTTSRNNTKRFVNEQKEVSHKNLSICKVRTSMRATFESASVSASIRMMAFASAKDANSPES
jgi:hypothetical protein